jgi:hypothetical protein
MDVNCLTWIVSLVVAEQKRLASSLVGYMGFYELRAAMEPPPLVMMPSKVVGGERPLQLIHGICGVSKVLSRRTGPENFMARIVSLLTRG